MVQAHQALLHVHARAHALTGTEQESDRPVIHRLKQCFLLQVCGVVLDEGDLFFRHTFGNQAIGHVLVGIPPARLRCP